MVLDEVESVEQQLLATERIYWNQGADRDALDAGQLTLLQRLAALGRDPVEAMASRHLDGILRMAVAERTAGLERLQDNPDVLLRLTHGLLALRYCWDTSEGVPTLYDDPYFWNYDQLSKSGLQLFFQKLAPRQTYALLDKCLARRPHEVDTFLYSHQDIPEVVPHIIQLAGTHDELDRHRVVVAVEKRIPNCGPSLLVFDTLIKTIENTIITLGSQRLEIDDKRPEIWTIVIAGHLARQICERLVVGPEALDFERMASLESRLRDIWPIMFVQNDSIGMQMTLSGIRGGPFYHGIMNLRSPSPDRDIRAIIDTLGLRPPTPSSVASGGPRLEVVRVHEARIYGLVAMPNGHVASVTAGQAGFMIWDPDSPAGPRKPERHLGLFTKSEILPDGRYVRDAPSPGDISALAVLADGGIATGSRDGQLRLWDPELPVPPQELGRHDPRTGGVAALATLPDGRVVSISSGGELLAMDPHRRLDPQVLTYGSDNSRPWKLAALPDGRIAYGWLHGVTIVDSEDRETLQDCEDRRHGRSIRSLAALPDCRIVTAGSEGERGGEGQEVWLWETDGGRGHRVLARHATQIWGVTVMPGGLVVSSSLDGELRVCDPDSGSTVATIELSGPGIAFAVDETTIVAADGRETVYVLRLVGS